METDYTRESSRTIRHLVAGVKTNRPATNDKHSWSNKSREIIFNGQTILQIKDVFFSLLFKRFGLPSINYSIQILFSHAIGIKNFDLMFPIEFTLSISYLLETAAR